MTPRPGFLRPGLLRHPLEGQLLVYDPHAQQVHLLDGTTATVVEMIDQGVAPDSIAKRLAEKEGIEGGAELLELALDQLAEARLIELPGYGVGAPVMETTRRQMIQRLVGLGATLAIPAIVTLTPSRAYASTTFPNGGPCSSNGDCISGCCHKEATQSPSCVINTCVARGSPCNVC